MGEALYANVPNFSTGNKLVFSRVVELKGKNAIGFIILNCNLITLIVAVYQGNKADTLLLC